jgi:hypothetical protein
VGLGYRKLTIQQWYNRPVCQCVPSQCKWKGHVSN